MTHIDLRTALQASMPGDYSDLVTRRTGALVRSVIEQQLEALAAGTVAFLDFSHIGVLDRSCADEIIAKLMLPPSAEGRGRDGYVVLHGLNEGHLYAIEGVLETHNLALVVHLPDVGPRLVGAVNELERRCWELVMQLGGGEVESLASEAGIPCESCRQMLEALAQRRLLRREANRYLPLGAAA